MQGTTQFQELAGRFPKTMQTFIVLAITGGLLLGLAKMMPGSFSRVQVQEASIASTETEVVKPEVEQPKTQHQLTDGQKYALKYCQLNGGGEACSTPEYLAQHGEIFDVMMGAFFTQCRATGGGEGCTHPMIVQQAQVKAQIILEQKAAAYDAMYQQQTPAQRRGILTGLRQDWQRAREMVRADRQAHSDRMVGAFYLGG